MTKMKENKNWKYLLTDEELFEMRKEIFKNRDSNHRVLVPKEFMEYLKELNTTAHNKSSILILYIGIILAYREAYHTYRKHHMNLETIAQLMGIKMNQVVRKEFLRNNYLAKKQFITYDNDMPVGYNYSYVKNEKGEKTYFVNYVKTSDLSPKELKETVYNSDNRLLRAIEPTRHTRGRFRKRGRGIQQISEPLERQLGKKVECKYITFEYETISDLVAGKISPIAFLLAAILKKMTNNKPVKAQLFKTSKQRLATILGITLNTFKKYHKELKEYTNHGYELKNYSSFDDGKFKSTTYLYFDINL